MPINPGRSIPASTPVKASNTMKTPKLLAAVPILALSASAVIGWSAITRASQADQSAAGGTSPDATSSEAEAPVDQARIDRMEAERKRIAERVGMSAPMEVELVNGKDPIREAVENGFIVEATLEEVEAALAAALRTSDLEDDIAAQRLKHQGSYRYFEPEFDKGAHNK